MRTTLRVLELFAGVGGFNLGFERANRLLGEPGFVTVWANQWEPGVKSQPAYTVYRAKFPHTVCLNTDISNVGSEDIPEGDILVGGFPCQDYSVAKTLNQSEGLIGKKGVLWWQIHRILRDRKIRYGLFENVDRLLASPAGRRGRDFAVMLASLDDIGYCAEWRVINSADYGFPQRRKRVFLLAYRRDSDLGNTLKLDVAHMTSAGVLAAAFPCAAATSASEFRLEGSLSDITDHFNLPVFSRTLFLSGGVMKDREISTVKIAPSFVGPFRTLSDVLVPEESVPDSFFIPEDQLSKWQFLKGAKSITRQRPDGGQYSYDEGPVTFPDALNRASRTIITGEGGSSPSRFKHVVRCASGRYRRLVPVELERLNGYPDNHTDFHGISDVKRAFMMGNAMIVEIVTRIAMEMASRNVGQSN